MGLTSDPEIGTTLLAVLGASLAALVWWMTREAAAGRIARTGALGIRVRRTLASDEDWVRGHQVALPWTVVGRYVAGLLAVAALAAVALDRAMPFGLLLGVAGVATVGLTWLGAVGAVNRALPD